MARCARMATRGRGYVVAMDPRDLVLAEQATYDPTSLAIAVPL